MTDVLETLICVMLNQELLLLPIHSQPGPVDSKPLALFGPVGCQEFTTIQSDGRWEAKLKCSTLAHKSEVRRTFVIVKKTLSGKP